MKRIIAMFLSTMLILMMSAFAFAAVDSDEYEVVITAPEEDEPLALVNEDDKFFVTGYIMANDDDIIEWIELRIGNETLAFDEDDDEFDDIIGEWDDDKFSFKFVVSPDDFDIEDDEDGEYDFQVSADVNTDKDSNIEQELTSDEKTIDMEFDHTADYALWITSPDDGDDIMTDSWGKDVTIKGWIQADEGDMLESLRIEIEHLDGDADEVINIIDASDDSVMMSNEKFEFEADWDLSEEGDFEITVFARIDVDEDVDDEVLRDEVTVEVIYDEDYDDDEDEDDDDKDEAMDNHPAAPAIANKLLKDWGYANRYRGTNLISEVAKFMGPNTDFDGESKLDAEDYEDAIEAFLKDRIDELDDMDVPAAPGNSANKGNGKDKDKGK
ncbi:hypothetical protein [Acidaminobacter hydrogenoformans]|uniref:hypothetical protein n=1 Tax=Acidaminobacter hydrogenoformans TaxID=65403 RepID=UPI000B806508|nr:hypothetical protein [Acidaminobacter hydrogenoformans]